MARTPDILLFDLGVVLLHLEYEPARALAAPHCDPAKVGPDGAGFFTLLGRTAHVNEYETGRLTAFGFFEAFMQETGFRGTFEEFAGIWRSIFRENDAMLDFGNEMAARYPCYFLTNASDLHVPWVFERFPRLRFMQGYHSSCYAGVMKPERAFYQGALDRFGLDPARCLFIDDRPENIVGAEALGIRSVLYTDAGATMRAVRSALAS